jgi:hypothetical protein
MKFVKRPLNKTLSTIFLQYFLKHILAKQVISGNFQLSNIIHYVLFSDKEVIILKLRYPGYS